MGTELDCCVLPVRHNMSLIQTTDFFYPLVDNPYTMGWITCCNVLSDLYAMGVVHCDNLLLLLGIAQEMKQTEREVSIRLLMQGFRDCALEAGTLVRGGQTVQSPWLMIGGVATSVCTDEEFIIPNKASKGDKIILTKPLGTQVAVNAYHWMVEGHTLWKEHLQKIMTVENITALFEAATMSMVHLNKTASSLMHKYEAHACTDVTGFGLVGHAENLVKFQTDSHIAFRIHSLPYLQGCLEISMALNDRFKLNKGLCPETSGGLLIVMPQTNAADFCRELAEQEGCPAWIIGDVIEHECNGVFLVSDPEYICVGHTSIGVPKLKAQ